MAEILGMSPFDILVLVSMVYLIYRGFLYLKELAELPEATNATSKKTPASSASKKPTKKVPCSRSLPRSLDPSNQRHLTHTHAHTYL